MPYELLNPYCLPDPLSPHIGAQRAGIRSDIGCIVSAARQLAQGQNLLLIGGGAGARYAPISATETMADVAPALTVPVLLVLGLRIGCLNRAHLSAQAIEHCGYTLRGWIGSRIDPAFAAPEEYIAMLTQLPGSAPMALLSHAADSSGDALELHAAAAALLGAAAGQR